MSWSRRRLSSAGLVVGGLIAAAALGGCGFKPLYGTSSGDPNAAGKLAQVEIGNIPDRRGQILRNHLTDRFYHDGYPQQTAYRLDIALESRSDKVALRNDASTERWQLTSVANFHLIDKTTNKSVLDGVSQAQIGYTVLDQQYGSLATANAVQERSLGELADDITIRVAAVLGRGS